MGNGKHPLERPGLDLLQGQGVPWDWHCVGSTQAPALLCPLTPGLQEAGPAGCLLEIILGLGAGLVLGSLAGFLHTQGLAGACVPAPGPVPVPRVGGNVLPGVSHTMPRAIGTVFFWVGRGQRVFPGDIPAGGSWWPPGRGGYGQSSFFRKHRKLTLGVSGTVIKAVTLGGPPTGPRGQPPAVLPAVCRAPDSCSKSLGGTVLPSVGWMGVWKQAKSPGQSAGSDE